MRWIKAVSTWLVDKAIEHWPTILYVFVMSGGMAYLAAISDWLRPWGPVGVGVAALLGGVSFCFCYFLLAFGRVRFAEAKFFQNKERIAGLNPLAGVFHKQRLNVSDFYSPFFKPSSKAKFEDCEIFGPFGMAIDGGNFDRCTFHVSAPQTPPFPRYFFLGNLRVVMINAEKRRMSKALALTERERGWLAHLARAHESGETLKAYAERHGLSRYSLYDAKSRLTRAGLWREITGKPKRQRAAFVPVRVTPPASPGWRLTHPSGWVLEGHSLPDPAWLHVVMAREEGDVTA